MIRTAMRQALRVPAWALALAGLLAASALLRLWLASLGPPIIGNDSQAYLDLAWDLRARDLRSWDGGRTPGYPALLALAEAAPERVRATQMALGLLGTTALFAAGWRLTGRPSTAFMAGAGLGLNLDQIRFESTVLTEALTSCWLALLALGLVATWRSARLRWLALSLLAVLLALTRPSYAFVPPLLVLDALFTSRPARRFAVASTLLLGCGPLLLLALRNAALFGTFNLTTLGGISLLNHTGQFVELAPDDYAWLRDPYLAARTAHEGDGVMVIWAIMPELVQTTGLEVHEISRALTELSLELIRRAPNRYLASVAVSWVQFWNTPGWWVWESTADPRLGRAIGLAWRVEKLVIVAANALFLGACGLTVGRMLVRRPLRLPPGTLWLALLVLGQSVLQAVVEHGENTRYAAPTVPIVLLLVVTSLHRAWERRPAAAAANRGERPDADKLLLRG